MAQTLDELVAHARLTQPNAKAVVWEHNSHVGDARATDLREAGQLNVGQLVRERHGERAFIAGFTTYTGTVTAASDWGGEAERKHVRPALPDSWEDVFHDLDVPAFAVEAADLDGEALERAIGVVYRPQTELISHYFRARAGEQFDMVLHFDETHAVQPLERTSGWERGELPDTYPWGV
jgi:erythromycin esterase-like protein